MIEMSACRKTESHHCLSSMVGDPFKSFCLALLSFHIGNQYSSIPWVFVLRYCRAMVSPTTIENVEFRKMSDPAFRALAIDVRQHVPMYFGKHSSSVSRSRRGFSFKVDTDRNPKSNLLFSDLYFSIEGFGQLYKGLWRVTDQNGVMG